MITLIEKKYLHLCNRDGELFIGRDDQGKCYLILEADTFYNEQVFTGYSSTAQISISSDLYESLSEISFSDPLCVSY